jgi:hypothetical protein
MNVTVWQILTHTPVWVWLMLSALLILGVMQSRPRLVARWQLLALPLALLLLGLWSMAPGFAAQPLAAVVWLASLVLGGRVGLKLPRASGTRWLQTQQRLQLPGSWMPMLIIVTIFVLRYVVGVAQAMHPALRGELSMQAALALAFGLLSGVFLGRAAGLWTLTRSGSAGPKLAV